jgi:hypothetical protein
VERGGLRHLQNLLHLPLLLGGGQSFLLLLLLLLGFAPALHLLAHELQWQSNDQMVYLAGRVACLSRTGGRLRPP